MVRALKGERVLVLGLGETGMSMARWLAARGAHVRVADSRREPPHAARLARELPGVALDCGPFRSASFESVAMIAISPGVPLVEPAVQAAAARGVEIVGDVELFARARDPRAKVVAITGSNGKSTVTTMAGEMCRAAGASTVVAGNIGLPVLDALEQPQTPDVYVLELSSFQLETTRSLDPDAAAMLNLSEDHLDRYGSMRAYADAKARIFEGSGTQVLNRDDAWSMDMRRPGRPVVTFGLDAPPAAGDWGVLEIGDGPVLAQGARPVLPVGELGVPGMHNAANALAAFALLAGLGLPEGPMGRALREFRGLPHRLQRVAEAAGIAFFDDSKGTNVGSTVAALGGMGRPCVLIAGGDGKGQDFSPLRAAVRANARAVVLIGRDAPLIEAALADVGVPLLRAATLDDAVRTAFAAGRPGDCVLLSPACASYDMFRDYRERGELFARAARALAAGHGSGA